MISNARWAGGITITGRTGRRTGEYHEREVAREIDAATGWREEPRSRRDEWRIATLFRMQTESGPSRPRTAYVRSIGASAVFDGGGSTFGRFGGASSSLSSTTSDDAFALPRRLRSGLTSAAGAAALTAGALLDAAACSGALELAAAADDDEAALPRRRRRVRAAAR